MVNCYQNRCYLRKRLIGLTAEQQFNLNGQLVDAFRKSNPFTTESRGFIYYIKYLVNIIESRREKRTKPCGNNNNCIVPLSLPCQLSLLAVLQQLSSSFAAIIFYHAVAARPSVRFYFSSRFRDYTSADRPYHSEVRSLALVTRLVQKVFVSPSHAMPPLASFARPLPDEDVKLPGINAILLGPPGSGKGTQVSSIFFFFVTLSFSKTPETKRVCLIR